MNEKGSAPKAKVFILDIHDEYLVRPATLIVPKGTEVTFKNLTDQRATLVFPKGLFNKDLLVVDAGKKETVTATGGSGAYAYTPVIPSFARIARGNSAPIVIIDP